MNKRANFLLTCFISLSDVYVTIYMNNTYIDNVYIYNMSIHGIYHTIMLKVLYYFEY